MPKSAAILICSTLPPTFYDELKSRLALHGRLDVYVVDCPISGGRGEQAAGGKLTIIASGTIEALADTDGLMRNLSEKLYLVPGGVGAASKVKMIDRFLVGTHIAAAAEAMALAAKAGLDTREVYDIIVTAAGNSWAFEDRVPRMLDSNWATLSTLDTFVQDMVNVLFLLSLHISCPVV